MFNRWQRELERAQWQGTVDRTLQDMQRQVSTVQTNLAHLHECVEKRLDPLLRWHYGLVGVVGMVGVCIPLILWLVGILRLGGKP